jgi:predicted RNA-binding protein YlxR (DUF448 family)
MPRRADTLRQCALTRRELPIADLIRFVVGPDDVLVPDIDARAEGRGVWITATGAAIAAALRKKVFAKSLKAPVIVPDDLAEQAARRLEQRLLGALGLARKAGQLATGAVKVRAAIDKGEVVALLTATDAAPDGRDKLVGALRARRAEAGNGAEVPHYQLLSSDQLGLALGLENVIHAALTKGAAAQSAQVRAARLARFGAHDVEIETRVHG